MVAKGAGDSQSLPVHELTDAANGDIGSALELWKKREVRRRDSVITLQWIITVNNQTKQSIVDFSVISSAICFLIDYVT